MNTEVMMKKILPIYIFIAPFFWGLFYDFSVAIAGCLLVMIFLSLCKTQNKMVWEKREVIFLITYPLGFLISIIPAIDRGQAFMGWAKVIVSCMFLLVLKKSDAETKKQCIDSIPYSGFCMTILSAIMYFIPDLKDYFFMERRMGGCFQYSNTFAMFLLVGVVLILFKERWQKYDYLMLSGLVIGILWSGSRTVFILLVAVFIIGILKNRKMRRFMMIFLLGIIGICILYVSVTGDVQNIGRIFTTSLQSSTFLGRILYYIDGAGLLRTNPMGLGYMGYYIVQPAIQTGVYDTMFIHNDWLQTGIDGGWIALAGMSLYFILCLLDKRAGMKNRFILLLLGIHMFLDFDMQYMYMFMLFVLFGESGTKPPVPVSRIQHTADLHKRRFVKKSLSLLGRVLIMGFLGYISVIGILNFLGNDTLSLKLFPWNTNIRTKVMLSSDNIGDAKTQAEIILKSNNYSYAAYNIMAVWHMQNGNYREMIRYKQEGLRITKYNIAEYEDYIIMLKKAIDKSLEENDTEMFDVYKNKLLEVPQILEEVKKDTNPLSWKLRDKPNLELDQEFYRYIGSYK